MISDDEILNAIAGPIDTPAAWRYQFWINSIFGCRAVAMLESDAKGSAAYLWVFAAATPNGVDFEENPSLVSSDSFDMQLVCEVPESLSNYWQHWRFARIGEIEEPSLLYRDGIHMLMRSFDGATSSSTELIEALKEVQPLRGQAYDEIFDTLDQLFGWKKILAESYPARRRTL
ncbi:MAG: hypothetical protein EOP04_26215 [Proteobacteria bacterium]|nr:MAG: hypothetical protein EOP04_26215 [Pseudomonadota bacterium]